MLEQKRTEYAELRSQVEATQTAAASESRDLTEAEEANVNEWLERAEAIRPRIEHLVSQEESFQATAGALARVTQGGTGDQVMRTEQPERLAASLRSMYPTPGHYALDVLLASNSSHVQRAGLGGKVIEAQARLARAVEVQRAMVDQLTSDNPGILPTPIVGEVISILDASRPVWASFTQRPMPASGKTFTRPIITQHTQVGKQATEKTVLSSRKMTVTGISLTKDTYGGVLDISVQDVDWTDPSILDLVISDLGDEYAIATEAAVSGLLAAVTQTSQLVAAPTAAQVATFIAQAAAKVYAGGATMPDRIWASVDMWALLVGMTATDGRPAFPLIGATNAAGSMGTVTSFSGSILGLPLVVGPALPASTLIVGSSKYAEAYEDRKGAVRSFEVSVLGWDIAYYGYAVGAILVANAFCKNSLT
jgi:HK97 family phage major capsid protein